MNTQATDQEIAGFLVFHIHNPCVEPITGRNIRDFYIEQARKVIPGLTNPFAREMLEEAVGAYSHE